MLLNKDRTDLLLVCYLFFSRSKLLPKNVPAFRNYTSRTIVIFVSARSFRNSVFRFFLYFCWKMRTDQIIKKSKQHENNTAWNLIKTWKHFSHFSTEQSQIVQWNISKWWFFLKKKKVKKQKLKKSEKII